MRDLLQPDTACPGFAMRRVHAGELEGADAEAVHAHVRACARCAATWAELERERCDLPPLEAFRAGVERKRAAARAPRRRAPILALALAAGLAAVVAAPLLRAPPPTATERTKGGAGLDLLVGGAGAVRLAADGERIAPGERVRLRVQPGPHRFAIALSVDDAGAVSSLYDRDGESLPLEPGVEVVLPDAIAFDGAGGERVYLFLSDRPLSTDALADALARAFRGAGSAAAMGDLPDVDAVQAHRLLIKPR